MSPREAALKGIYTLRTSLPAQRMSAEETVRSYKRLTLVECAFRSLKTMDLETRHPSPAREAGPRPQLPHSTQAPQWDRN